MSPEGVGPFHEEAGLVELTCDPSEDVFVFLVTLISMIVRTEDSEEVQLSSLSFFQVVSEFLFLMTV